MKYIKFTLNFLVFVFAWVIIPIASVLNFILVAIKSNAWGYFIDSAERLDRWGCGEFRTLWNTIFITKYGVKFKNDGNTISAYLGANEIAGKLSGFGKIIVFILSAIEKDHCLKAYNNRRYEIVMAG